MCLAVGNVRKSVFVFIPADDAQITSKALDTEKADNNASEAAEDNSNATQYGYQGEGVGKKKRKPKKKAKHLPLLPSVLAVEDQLTWKLEQTARLGRHAIAKQSIAAGAHRPHLGRAHSNHEYQRSSCYGSMLPWCGPDALDMT